MARTAEFVAGRGEAAAAAGLSGRKDSHSYRGWEFVPAHGGLAGTFLDHFAAKPRRRTAGGAAFDMPGYGPVRGAADTIAALFVPLAPHPAAEPQRYVHGAEPERRLMLAVLKSAIHDATSSKAAPFQRRDARDWIRLHDVDWPYSFTRICEALGFDAPELRDGILTPRRPLNLSSFDLIDAEPGAPTRIAN